MIFFFKQKTAYEMRISDWSSDVCSSDLARAGRRPFRACDRAHGRRNENTSFCEESLDANRQKPMLQCKGQGCPSSIAAMVQGRTIKALMMARPPSRPSGFKDRGSGWRPFSFLASGDGFSEQDRKSVVEG